MQIKLKIDKNNLTVNCEDDCVIVNEITEDDSYIYIDIVKPQNSTPNVYEQLITDRSVM